MDRTIGLIMEFLCDLRAIVFEFLGMKGLKCLNVVLSVEQLVLEKANSVQRGVFSFFQDCQLLLICRMEIVALLCVSRFGVSELVLNPA